MQIIIDKAMGSILGIGSRLSQIDSFDLSISREDLFHFLCSRQLRVYWKGDKESGTVLVSQVIVWTVTHYILSFVEVWKLNLQFIAINLYLVLLALIIGTTRTADKLESDKGIGLLWLIFVRHNLNTVNFAIDEEIWVQLFLSDIFWKIPDP